MIKSMHFLILLVLFTAKINTNPLNELNVDSVDVDLDELSPLENNCTRFSTPTSNTIVITCSRIPLFCRSVCDTVKRLDFDSSLKRISSFSFGSYQIKQSMELNFKSGGLERIVTDAFNGLVIDSDTQLELNIGYASAEQPNPKDQLEEQDIDYTDDEQFNYEQIEYDVQVSSTKSSQKNKKSAQKKQQLLIESNAFRGITIKEGGRLIVNIKGSKQIVFDSKSLSGDENKFLSSSSMLISVENANLVVFKPQCAKFWRANTPDYDYDTYYTNDYNSVNPKLDDYISFSVLFKLNLTNVKEVVFEKESFSNLKVSNSSTFQILVNKFNVVKLGESSFSRIEQAESSNFELNLSNGKRITLDEYSFANLTQAELSKFIVFVNILESNVCLKSNALLNLVQARNSTVRLTFLLNDSNSLVFNGNALANLKQSPNSFIQIYVLKSNSFTLGTDSIVNLNQSKSSSFEIWTSKGNFSVDAGAFKRVTQHEKSSIRIGYTSNPESFFKQAVNSFVDFSPDPTAELVYDFTKGSNFNLRFAPKPIPRFLPYDDHDQNRKKQSIEEIAWRLFPELGRHSRPDRLNLQDYKLELKDFCKVAEIPFDILVKLNPKTECSCTVYYLYRIVRHMDAPNGIKEWLSSAPECYRNKFLDASRPNQLDSLETACKFTSLVQSCKDAQMSQQQVQIDEMPRVCDEDSFVFYDNSNQEKDIKPNSVPNTDYNDVVYDKNFRDEKNDVVIKVVEDIHNVSDDANMPAVDVKEVAPSIITDKSSEEYGDEYETREEDDDDDEDFNESHEVDASDEKNDDDDDSEEQIIPIINTLTTSATTTKKINRSLMSVFNRINKSFSSFFKRLFQNKALLVVFILAFTSAILIGIIVLVICVNRCSRKSGKEGFSIYYDEYDDDDDDGDDENFTDSDEADILSQKKSPETYAKVNLESIKATHKIKSEQENSFGYVKLSEQNKSDANLYNDSTGNNKYLFVKCDTKSNNSFDSGISYLADESSVTASQYHPAHENPMNIKTNPFSLI